MPWSATGETIIIDTVEQFSNSSNSNNSPPLDEKDSEQDHNISIAAEDVPKIAKSHEWDPNLPQEKIDILHEAAKTGDLEKIHEIEVDFTEDSPYEEVRAAVRTTDAEEVANTVRAWVLGMIFVTLGSGLNMFLSMRSPAINFPSIVVQL